MDTLWNLVVVAFWNALFVLKWAIWIIWNAGFIVVAVLLVAYLWRRYIPQWLQARVNPHAGTAVDHGRVRLGEMIAGAKIGSTKVIVQRPPNARRRPLAARLILFVLKGCLWISLGYLIFHQREWLGQITGWFWGNIVSPPS